MSVADLTWGHVVTAAAVLVLILTVYTLIMNAIKAWREEKKRKNQPVSDLETRVKANTDKLEKHDGLLDNDKKRLDAIDEQQRILMRGIMALLSHEVNGNSIDKLKASLQEINDWLIRK